MTTAASALTPTEIDDAVQEQLQRWRVPGLSLGVLRDGVQEVRGYGVACLETGQAVTPGTLFQIGSISKTFTTVLVLQLVDEGLLDLDAPAKRYVPELRIGDQAAEEAVTLRHCLSHTGGYHGDDFRDYGRGDDALARAIAEYHTLHQYTRPGELWAYSNAGFDLAGRAVELALGESFEAAMRKRVFAPLGLERATYFAEEAITWPAAVAYNRKPEGEQAVARPYQIPRRNNPAGGVIATAGELLRLAGFLMGSLPDGAIEGKRLLSAESLTAMRAPQTVSNNFVERWGLGLSLRNAGGEAVVGHGGSTNGFRALLTLVPERRFAVAMLSNGDAGATVERVLERRILGRLAGVELSEPPDVPAAPEALPRFAGRYTRPATLIQVEATEGALSVTTTSKSPLTGIEISMGPLPLRPVGENAFRIGEGELEGGAVDFITAADGSVRFIRSGGRLAEPASSE